MDLTYIVFKDQMRKEVENFGWQVDDQFYTFWLNGGRKQKFYQYQLKMLDI